MAKNFGWPFLTAVASLSAVLSLTVAAQAQIGHSLDECRLNYGYGKIFLNENIYTFCGPKTDTKSGVRYFIAAFFVDGRVLEILYFPNEGSDKLYTDEAEYWLKDAGPEVVWSKPVKNKEETEMAWIGSVNGVAKYSALLKGTRELDIKDLDTTLGGVIGAHREIINGESVTVLPHD